MIVSCKRLREDIETIPNTQYAKCGSEDAILNIGGQKFVIPIGTLLAVPDSMLGVMFSGRHRVARSNGSCFIDRDPTNFHLILHWLRFQELPV